MSGPAPQEVSSVSRSVLFLGISVAVSGLTGLAPAAVRADGGTVGIVVLKEHGVGSPALAQPYLDRFVALAAEDNGWSSAKGEYYTSRDAAEVFIQARKPHYGILSLPAFLALRTKYDFAVVGQVAVTLAGGRQYYVVSKNATDLAGCLGKTLASDHTDDTRFIERVVAAGRFKLTDFVLTPTQRPLQTIKKVLTDEAVCALIDDAQLAELAHIDGGDAIRVVWKSAELPPMAVVAFPTAPAAERETFQGNLARLCEDEAQGACAEVGIVSLRAAGAADYAAVVAAYDK
jgi:hypothetical protein